MSDLKRYMGIYDEAFFAVDNSAAHKRGIAAVVAAAIAAVEAEGWQLVPVRMNAAMINAWSNGITVSSDSVAYNTTFQAAWTRVLAAAPKPAATDGWKTMDSAPRGGTQLLGYDAKTKTCHVTFAISKDDRWHDPDSHYYSECPPFDPTHWRHLPAAPEVE